MQVVQLCAAQWRRTLKFLQVPFYSTGDRATYRALSQRVLSGELETLVLDWRWVDAASQFGDVFPLFDVCNRIITLLALKMTLELRRSASPGLLRHRFLSLDASPYFCKLESAYGELQGQEIERACLPVENQSGVDRCLELQIPVLKLDAHDYKGEARIKSVPGLRRLELCGFPRVVFDPGFAPHVEVLVDGVRVRVRVE
jgi:hypothetical protein